MAEPGSGGASLNVATPRGTSLSWDDYSASWAALHVGVDPRRASVYVRTWLRLAFVVGQGLSALRVRPGTVTAAGLALSAVVPVAVAFRGPWIFAAAGLAFLSALADSTDGAVALITSRTSQRGSYYDSMADRLSEALWLLALWLLGAPGVLVVACGALAWLHEYARARAAVSGMTGIGEITVAERPTRVILVVVALSLGGLAEQADPKLTAGAVTVAVAVWTILGLLGASRLHAAIRSCLT